MISPEAPTEVDIWSRYDDVEQRLTAPVSERMLDLAGAARGQRVLDLATGRGEPALRAAMRVAPDGIVVGTDRSADMLAFAHERAVTMGITNLTLQVTDAETLAGVADASFDTALCRWGLMYFEQPRRALSAVRRCLVAGGTFVAAVWAEPSRVSYWSMPRDILADHVDVSPVDRATPGTFYYAESSRLRADLESAGFAVPHEEELATPVMEAASPGQLIEWCETFGLARLLAPHPAWVHEAWRRDMTTGAARFRDADGMYRLGGVTRIVVARAM